jgi:hypothetical protein
MLPSFRLIAVTFLCGFVVVFAGLRMAVSLHDIHEGLPVMAAHAAPVSVTPAADSEARRGVAAVPVMYDLRFAVSTMAPTLVRATPTMFDRPAPALSIALPPELTEPAKEQPEPESTVAALQPDAPVSVPPDAPPNAASDAPAKLDIPAKLDSPAEAPKPATQAVAAVQPQATPELETSTAEALIPEPDTTASVDTPEQSVDPAPVAASPPAATPTPTAKPKVTEKPTAKPAPKAVAKVVRKKRIRTAHRAAPANNTFGTNSASNPFGTP